MSLNSLLESFILKYQMWIKEKHNFAIKECQYLIGLRRTYCILILSFVGMKNDWKIYNPNEMKWFFKVY